MQLLRLILLVILIAELNGKPTSPTIKPPGKSWGKSAINKLYKWATPLVRKGLEKGIKLISKPSHSSGSVTAAVALDKVLTPANFKKYPVSSPGLQSGIGPDVRKFSFATVKLSGIKANVLQEDSSGVSGYWLPRNGAIDVPHTPTHSDPDYVFAPDVIGGSWNVSKTDNGKLRLKHSESEANPDMEIFKMGETPAFAFMRYCDGGWSLYVQDTTCVADPEQLTFKKGLLASVKMYCADQKTALTIRELRIDSFINGANVVKMPALTIRELRTDSFINGANVVKMPALSLFVIFVTAKYAFLNFM